MGGGGDSVMEVLPEFNLLDRRVHSFHTLIEYLQVHTSMLGAFFVTSLSFITRYIKHRTYVGSIWQSPA